MEKVMVVSTQLLDKYLPPKTFVTERIKDIISLIKDHHIYLDRDRAEIDSLYKQIIPYAIVINEHRVFMTRRLKKQMEKRLHGLYSIGLGGHINPAEECKDDVILEGMRRELLEEVGLSNYEVNDCVGVINDHTTEVSNYHLGLVYPIFVSDRVIVRETEKMTGALATKEEIQIRFNEMESWSRIAWENRNKWMK